MKYTKNVKNTKSVKHKSTNIKSVKHKSTNTTCLVRTALSRPQKGKINNDHIIINYPRRKHASNEVFKYTEISQLLLRIISVYSFFATGGVYRMNCQIYE